jgi:hypothetical protein
MGAGGHGGLEPGRLGSKVRTTPIEQEVRMFPHFVASFFASLALLLGQDPASQSALLHLRSGSFDPLRSEGGQASATPSRGNIYFVQFEARPSDIQRERVTDLGGTFYSYVPDHAYLVRADPAARDAVSKLPGVRWVGPFRVEYRLDETLLAGLEDGTLPPSLRVNVLLFERTRPARQAVADAIVELGGTVDDSSGEGLVLAADVSPRALVEIAGLDQVMFVDPWGAPEADSNLQRMVSGADYLEELTGFTGQGVRGEVFDVNFNLKHPELQAPPLLVHGTLSGTMNHGTPVVGLVFATGINCAVRGIVPSAQGIVASFGTLANRLVHTQELLEAPYFAVFQSNSWGSSRTTLYTVKSAEMDDIIFQTDLLITQSQGSGPLNQSRPEAWAKNILSVGSVRHHNTLTKSDDTWAFAASSGPANDGRIKPDLVHFMDGFQGLAGDGPFTVTFGGNSASTPIVAGYFGLFFQMWSESLFGNATPGSTVFDNRPHSTTAKAAMINAAYSYPFAGTTHDLTRVHQGWGLPDVGNLYDLRHKIFVVDETDVLSNQQSRAYALDVAPGEAALKATLCYLDPMAFPGATVHRINDLDLKATSPSGTVYWGNNGLLEGNWSVPGGVPNTLDTVENVFVQSPEAGVWSIEVIASSVNADSHLETAALDVDYALVVSGIECRPAAVYCTAKLNSLGCLPAISASGTASATASSGFVVEGRNVRNNKSGLLLYSVSGPAALPFQAGTLCLSLPIKRTPVVNAGGNPPPDDCSGVFSLDMNAFAAGLAGGNPLPALANVGTGVWCQWWGRDQGFAAPDNTTLSDGLTYSICP